MRIGTLLAILLAFQTGFALSNTIETAQFSQSSGPLKIDTPAELTIQFGAPPDKINCGLSIDWGDGEKQQLRAGPEQQLVPPFRIQHTYKTAATYSISIKGEAIYRGLRSTFACAGSHAGSITIVGNSPDQSTGTASAVQRAVSSVLTDPVCTPEKAKSWVPGVRTLVCSTSPSLGLGQLEQMSGMRVFLSGPHERQPNWEARTFGRYNPAFVAWAFNNLVPEKSAMTQQAYDRFARVLGRTLLLAYVRLRTNATELNGLANQYRAGTPANLTRYFQDNFDRDADLRSIAARGEFTANAFPVAMGFWARRETDGTSALFYAGLQKTLERFDADFLRRRDLGAGTSGNSPPGPETPRLIVQQAGNVTDVKVEGQLASTQNVGCIPLSEARNTLTPPDLYRGVTECLARDNYDRAVGLFALAGTYASFDSERVTDKTAVQAKSVLVSNTLLPQPEGKRARFVDTFNRILKTPTSLGRLCSEVQKVGAPNYYPRYMILHGMRAIAGNSLDDAVIKDFDAPATWKKVQAGYLNCPA